jgi:hypothetical protein
MRAFSVLAVVVALAAGAAAKDKQERHPHFDDQGTIPWHVALATASAAARKEGKLVFIEYGREK